MLTVIWDCEFVSGRWLKGDSISHLEESWAWVLPGDKRVIKHFRWQTAERIKHMKISLPEHNILKQKKVTLWKKLCSEENSPTGFGLLCWHSISVYKISSHADKTWSQASFFLLPVYLVWGFWGFFLEGETLGCKVARLFSKTCLLVLEVSPQCFCPSCRNTLWGLKDL